VNDLPSKNADQPLQPQSAQSLPASTNARQPPPLYQFNDLSQGSRLLLVDCEGAIYQLKRTRNGRLVLHK
jgi:hemin uptake protein HemP